MARSNSTFIRLVHGVLLATFVAGCGSRGGAATATVSGVIKLNGKPLAKATVVFLPEAKGNPGPPSSATTNDAGEYTLRCEDGQQGAVIGKHLVSISTRKMGSSPENSDIEIEVAKEQVPDSYRLQPLKFEVPKAGTATANFELDGPPPAAAGPGQHFIHRND
jgi:hypothetical protein